MYLERETKKIQLGKRRPKTKNSRLRLWYRVSYDNIRVIRRNKQILYRRVHAQQVVVEQSDVDEVLANSVLDHRRLVLEVAGDLAGVVVLLQGRYFGVGALTGPGVARLDFAFFRRGNPLFAGRRSSRVNRAGEVHARVHSLDHCPFNSRRRRFFSIADHLNFGVKFAHGETSGLRCRRRRHCQRRRLRL